MNYESISPHVITASPVDDEQMDGEQGDGEIPEIPEAARRFLDRHRPARTSSVDRDAEGDGEVDDENGDDEAGDQQEADGKIVDGEIVDNPLDQLRPGDPGYRADPEVPMPLATHPVPRPRAKGMAHPPVPTKAMVEKHALEQHVNYAAWCPHCLQASALMQRHPLVAGESPTVPTMSADFCFMTRGGVGVWNPRSRYARQPNQIIVLTCLRGQEHSERRVLQLPHREMC